MKRLLPLALALIVAACSDNGTVLGSHTNGGAGGTTVGSGSTLPGSGGSSTGGVAGNPGGAGMPSGSVGGTGSSGSTGSGGTSGAAGGAGTAGTAGVAGAPNDECGGCTPPYQVCIYQAGGPGEARFLCAEQQPCGSAGLCDCIVDQGECMVVLDDAGTSGSCSCDNGLD